MKRKLRLSFFSLLYVESNVVDSFMVPEDVSLIIFLLFSIRGLLIGVDVMKRGWKLAPRSSVEQATEGHKGFTWTTDISTQRKNK